MSTGAREAARARRAIGNQEFNQRYSLITDHAMPRQDPGANVLRQEVRLQQGHDLQGAAPLFSTDYAGIDPEAHAPVHYERRGDNENPTYNQTVAELEELRDQAPEADEVVNLVRHLPSGYRLTNSDRLRGLSIGELVYIISQGLGPLTLKGLYLDAEVVNLNLMTYPPAGEDLTGDNAQFNTRVSSMTTTRLPLWLVQPILPRSAEYPAGYTGGTVAERAQGFQNTMRMRYEASAAVLGFEMPDFEGNPDQHQDLAEIPGSDLSVYYIRANVRLVRRVRAPLYIDTHVNNIRTGGFAELITNTEFITITLDEVVEAYVQQEGLVHTDHLTEDYINEFRRVVGCLFSVDAFTNTSKTISVIVPGGVSRTLPYDSGCCIDGAVYHYLLRDYRGDYEAVANLMRRVRTRFEELYIEYRCSKRGSRKRRRATEGDSTTNVVTPSMLTHRERSDMLKDLSKITSHGYTSMIFKFFQRAVHCVTGYLPSIYYHRIEKARDYNEGVRVRMVQVGGGGVSKSLRMSSSGEGEEEGGSSSSQYIPINMLRININGEIHRHRPRTLCCEDMVEFIPDDDVTGLLHSIAIYPGLPDDLFKGVNAKKREVLLRVVEAKTKELMKKFKRRAVGLTEVTIADIQSGVREQLHRQDSGQTNTLIYGKAPLPEEIATDDEGTSLSSSSFSTSERGSGAPFYKSSFNKYGESVAPRPLVIAYDIETVTLEPEAIRDAPGMIGPEFLRGPPTQDRSTYTELERQIPFCISWAPVCLSDEGRHRRLLEERHASGNEYPSIRDDEAWAGRWEGSDRWVTCSDGRRVRVGYILLDKVRVHYGGYVLGRCIEEFMECVMWWAMERGYTSVHAYAHNGVGFDSYIVQSFNTKYEYNTILKTNRGILSMRARIPYETELTKMRKFFPITFLDTKVFLSFSLSKLCNDFKVPSNWGKLDFPITKITWRNCYHPEVLSVLEPYSINDTRALAYIIKQINRIVCLDTEVPHIPGCDEMTPQALQESILARQTPPASGAISLDALHPPNPSNPKPPIVQFCTIMSCVKRIAAGYLKHRRSEYPDVLNNPLLYHGQTGCLPSRMPMACDVPSIRHWIEMASMGGRVSPYAKVYCSSAWGDVLRMYLEEGRDLPGIADRIRRAILEEDTSIVLDVTSLYPSAMAYCPMPLGSLAAMSPLECREAIESLACETCERALTLCPTHRHEPRPFGIVIVGPGGLKRTPNWEEHNKHYPYRHLVGRKLKGRRERGGSASEKLPGPDVGGVVYTCEEDEEMTRRYWGPKAAKEVMEGLGDSSVLGGYQAYTTVDLYWASKSGYWYDVVGGYRWETTYELQPLIIQLFQMRVQAKKAGNTCLQQALKLVLNSYFGVHSQRVIRTVDKIVRLPESIRESDAMEDEFGKYIRANHQKIFDPRMKLKENIPLANGQSMVRAEIPGDIGEGVGGYSPNQVGCAVLAWSRHIMNLAMFNVPTGHLTYTDTDSLAVSEHYYNHMLRVSETVCKELGIPPVICLMGNELLTYKNDHSDYFRDPRVLFSAIGAKKVKMHIIGCPDTGELMVCSTFKGFLKQDTLDNGDRLHPHSYQYVMAKALLDILYDGCPEAYAGTRWDRDLARGVTINRNVTVEGDSYTYLGKHLGLVPIRLDGSRSRVAVWVPYGVKRPERVYTTSPVIGVGDDQVPPPILRPQRTPKRSYPPEIVSDPSFFIPPNQYTYRLPAVWQDIVLTNSIMGGVTRETMYRFIHIMFSRKDDVYRPGGRPPTPTPASGPSAPPPPPQAQSTESTEEDPQVGSESYNPHPYPTGYDNRDMTSEDTNSFEEELCLDMPNWEEMCNIFDSVEQEGVLYYGDETVEAMGEEEVMGPAGMLAPLFSGDEEGGD